MILQGIVGQACEHKINQCAKANLAVVFNTRGSIQVRCGALYWPFCNTMEGRGNLHIQWVE